MSKLSDFEEYIGKRFDVCIDGAVVDQVTLVRGAQLKPSSDSEVVGVRLDPFELLFRSATDKVINQSVLLVAEDKSEREIFLNPECFHREEGSDKMVTQYYCLFA